ncbi:hypothetical protein BU14_0166s0011 [Porphyra umbilicalis]|uniref:F-ATPase gamma subunit n=1 Tax=Porphyra umbilicalis TaxID=2786 RepID=A0A1X6P878_PORUM|nr:hypothetical protein BU14_0166s0011 [Porphyra umbilicalis]|eukprot:OSX76970.1 hypothetical protein BU14_0166s0011 [Porphyra umbilicalis]
MTSRVALKVAMRAAGNSPGAAGALGASLSGRGSLWAPVAPAMASVGAPRGQSSPSAVAVEEQVRWVNLKVVRERMKTVANIGKICKAMKLVAAAKLRGVQSLQEASRPFATGLGEFFSTMDDLEAATTAEAAKTDPSGEGKKQLIIAVTSDRGLCGGVNAVIVKEVKQMMIEDAGATPTGIMLVGDKGREPMRRVHGDNIVVSFKDVFKAPITFPQVCMIAEDVLARSYTDVVLVYNRFKSAMEQEPVRKPIVGLSTVLDSASAFDEYEFDSDMDSAQVFVDLFEFQLATQLYNALLENATSEQAARMSAMDNASRNSTDMHAKLALTANRVRQAGITTELSEIVAGAASVS